MGGFFGITSQRECLGDVFFGVDYHSHLGTRRGGLAAWDAEFGLQRKIHSIENAPFRTRFEHIFEEMRGTSAIGCISDSDPQPLLLRSRLGAFAICMVGVIRNADELIYKVVGSGTGDMASFSAGQQLDVLTGLGNGYDLSLAGDHPLLVGGGVGVPPLFWLARMLRARGKQVSAVLGFPSAGEVFLEREFRDLGAEVTVTTEDGSLGIKGYVTDALPPEYSFFYACGPRPMLWALSQAARTDGQLSMEERMGCGFGACMGCTCRTASGPKRICREGPVLRKEEILWND